MTNASLHFSMDEWNQISQDLAKYHSVFYRFWTVSRPWFTEAIPTAAVSFDKHGEVVDFRINPVFWESLTATQKLFVICHECQHLILNHGKRAKHLFANITPEDMQRLNIAMDIAVNESLISRFDFSRAEVDPDNKYIWADKVGNELGVVLETNRCFEYYYSLLKKQPDDKFPAPGSGSGSAFGETVDHHEETPDEQADSGSSEAVEKMLEDMDATEREALERILQEEQNKLNRDAKEGGFQAGDTGLGDLFKIADTKVVTKKKWETVIRKWSEPYMVEEFIDRDQWAKTARRFTLLTPDLMLPFEEEIEELTVKKEKVDVWFFLDTSGSCIHLKDRFFNAALSLPKRRFNVHLHGFDTKVYPSDFKTKTLRGGGGTKFDIIEKYIVKESPDKYPAAVFIITDGMGNEVHPKKPKHWHWFLSFDYRDLIPIESKIYMLNEYE